MEHIQDIVTHYHYLGLFTLLILGGMGLPFPEDATLILTGVLIAAEVIRPVPALLVVYVGVVAGDCILYYLGRRFGTKVVEHRGFRKLVTPARIEYIEDMFKRRGVLLIVLGRHFVGLRAQLMVVAGIIRMKMWEFVLADAFSATFTVAVMVFVGYKGGESINKLRRGITHAEHILAVALVTAFVVYLFYKYFQSRAAREDK